MPLEDHWARQHAGVVPASRRELRALAAAGAVALVTALVIGWALVTGSQPAAVPGCTRATVAMATGGATIERCSSTPR